MKGQPLLISRLKKGQQWLIDHYDAYMDGSIDAAKWYEAFDAWDGLDYMLRFVYSFEECPVSQCSKESPVICRGCAD